MIRKVTMADADSLWLLRTQAIVHGCSGHYSKEIVSSWSQVAMPDNFAETLLQQGAVVLERQGELLGFGFVDIAQGQLEALFIAPNSAGKGYGKQIAEELLTMAEGAGVRQLALSSSLNAVVFYQGLGFKVIEETCWQHPAGFDLQCVSMTKQLISA